MPVEASWAAVGSPAVSAGAKLRAAAAGKIQRRSVGVARQAIRVRRSLVSGAGRQCAKALFFRTASMRSPSSVSSMKVCAAKHCRHSLNACTRALLLTASKDVVVGMGAHGASAFRRGKLVKISSRSMKKMAGRCGPAALPRCHAREFRPRLAPGFSAIHRPVAGPFTAAQARPGVAPRNLSMVARYPWTMVRVPGQRIGFSYRQSGLHNDSNVATNPDRAGLPFAARAAP